MPLETHNPEVKEVISVDTARQMMILLQAVTHFGTGAAAAALNHPFGGKTGTTNDYRDAWTMGYTPNLVVGVWAGTNDNTPMTLEAADISAPMWKSMMAASMAGKSIDTFPKPSGLQTLSIPGSAYVSDSSSGYKDLFPSWYKNSAAKSVVIDIVSGLLATDCTPPLAKKTVYYSVSGSDNVHSCDDAQPTVSISGVVSGWSTRSRKIGPCFAVPLSRS